MELKMSCGYAVIWSHDLQEFANQFLNREWDLHKGEDFPAQDYSVKFEIDESEWIVDDIDADFDNWLAGGDLYDLEKYPFMQNLNEPNCESIMQYLFNIGKIPAGRYLVEVNW
jgi:hypothetical protein